jgi:hypothetical protein
MFNKIQEEEEEEEEELLLSYQIKIELLNILI